MFASLNPGSSRQRNLLAASLSLHAVLFAWLLHTPDPQLLQANSVANGRNGRVLTTLYWPSEKPDDSSTSSPANATQVYRRQSLGHEKLIWKQTSTPSKLPLPTQLSHTTAEDKSQIATISSQGHGALAGMRYGSVPGSPVYGDEIRPALPVTMPDPVVYPWELPASEGNVTIEFTIDERGEVVRTTVIQSMGPKLDQKALAAAANWHFTPAMHNGVAIASKQDYIFHFRARG
jgi:TonB family protein